jgi:thiaminase (transcriptional activator TenA)
MSTEAASAAAATTSATSDGAMRYTDELKAAAGDQWERIVTHKFTTELAANTIDRAVLRRYLIQDYRFLDAFVVLLSSVIAHCRTLADRIPGCQFLALITGKENTYFERCFAILDHCDEATRAAIPDAPCTIGFCSLMRDAAKSGSLGEMLAVLVVCEWSYLSWAQRVLASTVVPVVRDDFCTYEWIDLHSGPQFEQVVAYVRGLLDQEGLRMTAAEKERCRQRFLQAVQLEEDFFDYAYNGTD